MLQKIKGPRGEEFEVISSEAAIRILNEGVPFIAAGVEIKKLVVKEGEVFLYTDVDGNIPRGNTYGLGLYYKDMRFLNTLELYMDGKSPLLLSSTAELDYRASIELTNPDITDAEGKVVAPQETLNIRRLRVVRDNLYERIRVKNYNLFPVKVNLQLVLGADFFDIFEVRGLRRLRRGHILKPKYDGRALSLAYFGLDDVFRQTRIEFWPQPTKVQAGPEGAQVSYYLSLKPHETRIMNLAIKPVIGTERRKTYSLDTVSTILRQSYSDWEGSSTKITTDNELFNSILERSERDIRQLLTPTKHGTILAAGVPWFVAPFGRDALIASVETLMLNPGPAYESLKMMAGLQGKEVDEMRDEEPGKIFHEIRQGELTNLNEVPYTPYYGSADATPLFLIAICELFKFTRDLDFLNTMLDPMERALRWIDDFGDLDGDLFVEYLRKSPRGLINQGWKDSGGAICHKDGTKAESPIAVAEVQGYVYRAKKSVAEIYSFLGEADLAKKLAREAEALKERFNKIFWMEERGCLAMALDKDKKRVEAITSNAGQCLFGGIVDEKKAQKLAERLMQPDVFSGWGIRTLSKGAPNYNPMSYHSGTVWPHDNAIIIWGLKRYGFTPEALLITSGLFDATVTFDYVRLPELFCGFSRRTPHPPVGYPVSCAPQAWAAASIFFMLQTILGLRPDAVNNTLYVNPTLPRWLNEVKIKDLNIGQARVSIVFNRKGEDTSYRVSEKPKGFRVLRENKVGGL